MCINFYPPECFFVIRYLTMQASGLSILNIGSKKQGR